MRKIIALLLVLILVLSMTCTAFAAFGSASSSFTKISDTKGEFKFSCTTYGSSKITVVVTLQEKSGNSWINTTQSTTYTMNNVSSFSKTGTFTLTPGKTYRAYFEMSETSFSNRITYYKNIYSELR